MLEKGAISHTNDAPVEFVGNIFFIGKKGLGKLLCHNVDEFQSVCPIPTFQNGGLVLCQSTSPERRLPM